MNQLLQQAMALHQAGRLDDAERLYAQALALAPGTYSALHLMGILRLQQGRLPEALALMEQALTLQPGAPDTLANVGLVLSAMGRHQDALQALDQVVKARPQDSQAFSNRGGIKSKLKQMEEALADFDRAIALDRKNADALNNRGLILHALGRYDDALAAFDVLLTLAPDYAEGLNNRGLALHDMGRPQDALIDFDRLVKLQPGRPGGWINRAAALWRLDRLDEALENYTKALQIDPNLTEALESRSNLLWTGKRALDPAIADLERALATTPDLPFVRGDLLHLKMHAGDWQGFDQAKAELDKAVRAGAQAARPFVYQGLSDSAEDMLICAATYAGRFFPPKPPIVPNRGARAARRPGLIRVGYVSGEFRAQATMYLMAGLFESHDRSRFEVLAFDNGGDDGSPMRQRVVAGVDKFIPIASLSERDAAQAVAAEAVDILVNVNGYFGGMRMNLFAQRPAPIQVNYLGFPGTLGADYMDYILADATLIPDNEHRFYREKVVTLPDCYQINDSKRAPLDTTSRAEHGLPELPSGSVGNAFVFCHFNYGYKITPDLFACWMRLLHQVPDSLVWLLAGDPLFQKNLTAEARKAGIDPARLVFALPLPLRPHIARLALGDLFLDSLFSNGHTTASDALWAGLPLVTRYGGAFQGRVAASLLRAIGLPELVTGNLQEYEALALKLARDPALLKSYRRRLAENRGRAPLFDTARTTRHIEAAYEKMQGLRLNGEAPQSFAV